MDEGKRNFWTAAVGGAVGAAVSAPLGVAATLWVQWYGRQTRLVGTIHAAIAGEMAPDVGAFSVFVTLGTDGDIPIMITSCRLDIEDVEGWHEYKMMYATKATRLPFNRGDYPGAEGPGEIEIHESAFLSTKMSTPITKDKPQAGVFQFWGPRVKANRPSKSIKITITDHLQRVHEIFSDPSKGGGLRAIYAIEGVKFYTGPKRSQIVN